MRLHIVIGSSGLVGSELVRKLSKNQGDYILALDSKKVSQEKETPSNVSFIQASVTSKADLETLSNLVNEKTIDETYSLSSVTFLQSSVEPRLSKRITPVSQHGVSVDSHLYQELRRELWKDYSEVDLMEQFTVNLGGTQNVLQAIYGALIQSPHASVIFLSSVFARVPLNQDFLLMEKELLLKPPGYSSSKSALENYSRFLMGLFHDTNCRFNCISPGPINISRPQIVNKKFEDFTAGSTLVDSGDVVNTILLIHSEQARSIRGSVIEISNGWGGF